MLSPALFGPDDLSPSSSGGSAAPLFELPDFIAETLELHFGESVQRLVSARVAGSSGTSGRSILLETQGGHFFLKWRTGEAGEALLKREMEWLAFLSREGCSVPSPIAPDRRFGACGHPWVLSEMGQHHLALLEFVEGIPFPGSTPSRHMALLEEAGSLFGHLVAAALTAAPGLRSLDRPSDEGGLTREFPERLENLVVRTCREQPTVGRTLTAWKLDVREEMDVVAPVLDDPGPVVPMHLDFHPRNLLVVPGGRVTAVDFEHFRPEHLAMGFGFGFYKNARELATRADLGKALSQSGSTAGRGRVGEFGDTAMKAWFSGWRAAGLSQRLPAPPSRPILHAGARLRVLSLIHKILFVLLEYGDRRFVYDLGKQLRSLRELDLLFSRPRIRS